MTQKSYSDGFNHYHKLLVYPKKIANYLLKAIEK